MKCFIRISMTLVILHRWERTVICSGIRLASARFNKVNQLSEGLTNLIILETEAELHLTSGAIFMCSIRPHCLIIRTNRIKLIGRYDCRPVAVFASLLSLCSFVPVTKFISEVTLHGCMSGHEIWFCCSTSQIITSVVKTKHFSV